MRIDRRHIALLSAILSVNTACIVEEILAPLPGELIVHAIIDMDARDQYVHLKSSRAPLADQLSVSGATVTITTPDGRVLVADEIRDTLYLVDTTAFTWPLYRVSLNRYGVTLVGGGTYRLRVVLAGGAREASGTTTLPEYPATRVIAPVRPFDRARDTLRLAWPRVGGARSYEVDISSAFAVTYASFADTSIVLPGTAHNVNGSSAFVVGLSPVRVLAVDANYYDYYRRSSDPLTGTGVVNHLEGAVGVFGSIVRVGAMSFDVR